MATLVDLLHLEPVHVHIFRRWAGLDDRGWRRWLGDLAKAGIPVLIEDIPATKDHSASRVIRLAPDHVPATLPGASSRVSYYAMEAEMLVLREVLDARDRQIRLLEELIRRIDQQAAK